MKKRRFASKEIWNYTMRERLGELVNEGTVQFDRNVPWKQYLYSCKLRPGKLYCIIHEYENGTVLTVRGNVLVGWYDPNDDFNPKKDNSCLTKGMRYDNNDLFTLLTF